jgi:hypothetical protein
LKKRSKKLLSVARGDWPSQVISLPHETDKSLFASFSAEKEDS